MQQNFVKSIVLALFGMFFISAVTFSADELSKATFKVDTKDKSAKVKIETVVSMLKGVNEAELNLSTKKLEVKYDPSQIEEGMIRFVVESMGYPVVVEKRASKETTNKSENRDSTKK
ncbi:MAG: cation transporter [Candidatus Kapaibacteriota bacterium]|jgi:cation transport ATPase